MTEIQAILSERGNLLDPSEIISTGEGSEKLQAQYRAEREGKHHQA